MAEELETPNESAFIIATLENAHELVVDAETLLKAERWARAYALATFAVEETGKAWLADQAIAFDPKRRIKRVHHIGKLQQAREMVSLYLQLSGGGAVDINEVYSEAHEFWSEEDFNNRMAGLYVDFVDGEVVGGPQAMSPEHARGTVGWAAAVAHIGMRFLWRKHGGPVHAEPPTVEVQPPTDLGTS